MKKLKDLYHRRVVKIKLGNIMHLTQCNVQQLLNSRQVYAHIALILEYGTGREFGWRLLFSVASKHCTFCFLAGSL